MLRHSQPNAAAFKCFEERGVKSETSMPQHSVTNAAAFVEKPRKIKGPTKARQCDEKANQDEGMDGGDE